MASIFVDVPQTIGKGRFDIGASYLYVEFAELDGEDLDGLTTICNTKTHRPSVSSLTRPSTAKKIDLFSTSPTCDPRDFHVRTYGITDQWDVNVLVPIVVTSLDVEARASSVACPACTSSRMAGSWSARRPRQKVGVGDIPADEYRFMKPGLQRRLGSGGAEPTGEKNDFQGSGE